MLEINQIEVSNAMTTAAAADTRRFKEKTHISTHKRTIPSRPVNKYKISMVRNAFYC